MSVTVTVISNYRDRQYYPPAGSSSYHINSVINIGTVPAAKALWTDEFEETSSTPTEHSLTNTAETSGAIVSFNGRILPPSKYIFTSATLQIDGPPVTKGDAIVVTYNYQL